MKLVLLLFFICQIQIPLQGQEIIIKLSLDSLIKSELAFARLSEDKGIREAFLTYLTDDAIVFRPKPVKGKKLYKESKENGSKLIWKPIYADIATSGDLGFTTGPWNYSIDTIKVSGHYVTIWQKQKDGNWKVILDAGIPHHSVDLDKFNLELPEKIAPNVSMSSSTDKVNLSEIEKSISQECDESKSISPLVLYFDKTVRLYRTGQLPIIGKDNVEKFLSDKNEYYTWATEESKVSDSGDFGFSYGTGKEYSTNNSREFSYLRIWKKKNSEWKIILDLSIPIK